MVWSEGPFDFARILHHRKPDLNPRSIRSTIASVSSSAVYLSDRYRLAQCQLDISDAAFL
jgi:hypothetical protein